jgi:hypothetical protein
LWNESLFSRLFLDRMTRRVNRRRLGRALARGYLHRLRAHAAAQPTGAARRKLC